MLSYFTTLGICAFVFSNVLGFPGTDSAFPIFAFIFLVALGIDYNIFLMTRVREESVRIGTRPGILKGLAVTGGVITSAGVVLAATFLILTRLPLVGPTQIGVAVAIGVLVDTLIVRSILVPALSYDFGPPIWWPSASGAAGRSAAGRGRGRPARAGPGRLTRRRRRLARCPAWTPSCAWPWPGTDWPAASSTPPWSRPPTASR